MTDFQTQLDDLRDQLERTHDHARWLEITHEIEQLIRDSVFSPRPGWRRDEWSPIRQFTWSFPTDTGETHKELVKVFARALSTAIDLTLRRPGFDPAMVALVRMSQEGSRTAFTTIAPYREPFDFLERVFHTPSASPEHDRFGRRAGELELELRFGLLADTLVPIVISCGPDPQTVVLDNRRHLGNPREFLDPELCRSTSGFLSFVGAVSLVGDETPLSFDDASVLSRELDEWLRWLHYCMKTGVLLDPDRLLVNRSAPERYVFEYDGS
jgi:hypothetical protein